MSCQNQPEKLELNNLKKMKMNTKNILLVYLNL